MNIELNVVLIIFLAISIVTGFEQVCLSQTAYIQVHAHVHHESKQLGLYRNLR